MGTDYKVTVRGVVDELPHNALGLVCLCVQALHVEAFAKTQLTEDIEGQIVAGLGHVLDPRSHLCTSTEHEAEFADMLQDRILHAFYSTVGKGLAHHPSLTSMNGLGNGRDNAVDLE